MTKHFKFEVVLPSTSTTDIKVYKFKTMKEIQDFLGVSYATLYNLRQGRLKCKHYTKSHLKGVKINKIDYERVHYIIKKKPLIEKEDYFKSLDESFEGLKIGV
jgi:hypothetical protein